MIAREKKEGRDHMQSVMCLSVGYLIGSLNPAMLLARLKNVNLREEGSGNPGATNTMLVMGFRFGLFVLLCDLLKTLVARRVARLLFPQLYLAGLLGACGAVIGHMFPFYMNFQGGKGVACLAGLVLSYDIGVFLLLLAFGVTLMFVFNYGIIAPVTVAAVFPLLVLWQTGDVWMWLLTASVGLLIICRHRDNFERIKQGEEMKVRTYFGERIRARLHCREDKK